MSIDFHPADYAPDLVGYTGQGAFRFWCQKVLPIVYDDSLSYYELLNKVVVYLNNVISDVAATETNVSALYDAYNELQTFVNDFFSNLSVDEEINNKLDAMAEDGTLSALIGPFIPAIVTDWLNTHITPTNPPVDDTLNISGAAADAKVTGDNIRRLNFESFRVLGNFNVDDLSPDTVPASPGYYISPMSVTEAFTGVAGNALFMNYVTPAHNIFMQWFILLNGRKFYRYSHTGAFTEDVDNKAFRFLGNLSTADNITPDNVPNIRGYYISPASNTNLYLSEYKDAIFNVYTTASNIIYLQEFVLDNGKKYIRRGNSGAFISYDVKLEEEIAKAFRVLGNFSADGLTPDTVPASAGYYISPMSVTETFTGVSANALFMNYVTPANNVFMQWFILLNGRKFYRYSNTGAFTEDVDNQAIRFLGNLSVAHNITPDSVPGVRGYYISPSSNTNLYLGERSNAIFNVYTTAGNAIYLQEFILSNGKRYVRYGNTGEFINADSNDVLYYKIGSSDVVSGASDSTGGVLWIYIPYSSGKHLRIGFMHGTRPAWVDGESVSYKEGDFYRFDSGIVGKVSGQNFTAEFELITHGAWDGATYTDYNDTSGVPVGGAFGSFHGWEKYSRCVVSVDGSVAANLTPGQTLPDVDMRPCYSINILYWSDIYLPGTSTIIANAFKRYTVDAEGVHCYTEYKWVTEGRRAMYVAMGCVSRALTDSALCDYDNVLYDVTDHAVTPITGMANNKPNVSRCVEFGSDNSAMCELKLSEPIYMYIQNQLESTYNKIYFNYHETVSANKLWQFGFTFTFGGNVSIADVGGEIAAKRIQELGARTTALDTKLNSAISDLGVLTKLTTYPDQLVNQYGTLQNNGSFESYDYDVTDYTRLNIVCNTTVYGASSGWAFVDDNNAVISHGVSSGSGAHSATFNLTVPANATKFRVCNRATGELQEFGVRIVDAYKTISRILQSLS